MYDCLLYIGMEEWKFNTLPRWPFSGNKNIYYSNISYRELFAMSCGGFGWVDLLEIRSICAFFHLFWNCIEGFGGLFWRNLSHYFYFSKRDFGSQGKVILKMIRWDLSENVFFEKIFAQNYYL